MYEGSITLPPVELRLQLFSTSPLGALYRPIPFAALGSEIPPPPRAVSGKGRKPWLDLRGGLALQILKSYYGCSDAKLIELLNGSWQMQRFCSLELKGSEQIKDKGLVSRWRTYLSQYLDTDKLQLRLVQHRRPYIQHPHSGFCDATVFESYITYPSDVKLLWRAIEHVYGLIQGVRKQLGLRASRIRHKKRKSQSLSFARRRKKSRRVNKKMCRWLVTCLQRLERQLQDLHTRHHPTQSHRSNTSFPPPTP